MKFTVECGTTPTSDHRILLNGGAVGLVVAEHAQALSDQLLVGSQERDCQQDGCTEKATHKVVRRGAGGMIWFYCKDHAKMRAGKVFKITEI